MYATDILWRVGIALKNPCMVNFVIFLLSSGCYVYRAILEERYLSRWPEYREYMQKVRHRFLPGIL
jgi:protein-S-isoprenylcysteine O-methyltransferase Ste14